MYLVRDYSFGITWPGRHDTTGLGDIEGGLRRRHRSTLLAIAVGDVELGDVNLDANRRELFEVG